jgi:hypothetical protein
MKLRRIDAQRFCDDETGTYFDFSAYPEVSFEKAQQMIQMDMDCFLSQYPSSDYFGTQRFVLDIGQVKPPQPPPEEV